MTNKNFKAGIVSLVGKPNVGKSSLLNLLVGEKVAIVSDKVQTTRNRIGGIVNLDDAQIVFYDTPGIHKPLHKLGKYILQVATNALNGADLLTVILDIEDGLMQSDKLVSKHVLNSTTPVIVLVNKIDTILENISESEISKNEKIQNFINKVTKSYCIPSHGKYKTDFGAPIFS